MPYTLATCDFHVNAYGSTNALLSVMINPTNIPLDLGYIHEVLGVTVHNDGVVVGPPARRRVELSLDVPPWLPTLANAPRDPNDSAYKLPWLLTAESTSAEDSATGDGAHQISVDYHDSAGTPHTVTIDLNGQTAVAPVITGNFPWRIDNVQASIVGSLGVNAGRIILRQYPISTRDNTLYPTIKNPPGGELPGLVTQTGGLIVGTVPEGFWIRFPNASGQAAPFEAMLTQAIQNAVGPAVTVAVVLS